MKEKKLGVASCFRGLFFFSHVTSHRWYFLQNSQSHSIYTRIHAAETRWSKSNESIINTGASGWRTTIPTNGTAVFLLFPLDSARRLWGDIVDHSVHTTHLITDFSGYVLQEIRFEWVPVSCHTIRWGHRSEGHHVRVSALIALYTCTHKKIKIIIVRC